jgi:hypothetical protein
MALGKLQSVAKNMCLLLHRIRRLKLWTFDIPATTAEPICPRNLPGYCPLGWKEINMDPSFFPDFWLPAFNSPNANNKWPTPWVFPFNLGCGLAARKIPRVGGAKSAMMPAL